MLYNVLCLYDVRAYFHILVLFSIAFFFFFFLACSLNGVVKYDLVQNG